jgi:hypothetical protein
MRALVPSAEELMMTPVEARDIYLAKSDHELLVEMEPEIGKQLESARKAIQALSQFSDRAMFQELEDLLRDGRASIPRAGRLVIRNIKGKPYRYVEFVESAGGKRKAKYLGPAI